MSMLVSDVYGTLTFDISLLEEAEL